MVVVLCWLFEFKVTLQNINGFPYFSSRLEPATKLFP